MTDPLRGKSSKSADHHMGVRRAKSQERNIAESVNLQRVSGCLFHTSNERIAKICCPCCKDQARSPTAFRPASCKDFDVLLHTFVAIVVIISRSSHPGRLRDLTRPDPPRCQNVARIDE